MCMISIMCLWVWFSGFEKSEPMCFYEEEKKEKEWRKRKKMAVGVSLWRRNKERKRKKKKKKKERKAVEWVCEEERREKVTRKKSKDATSLWPWVPKMCVYLQKCHHSLVFITQKHPKVVFSFANSPLKNQKIEWWKQNLKTQPNKLPFRGTHQFWVMDDENRVMSDGKHYFQTTP